MMRKITYNVEFYSDWHCGSGLAAGAEADAVVVKDKDGLPFVPGKTLKGLVDEAYMAMNDRHLPEGMFFSNAEFSDPLKNKIMSESLTGYLYRNIASIAMQDGITVSGSLRTVQVTVPCTLSAFIMNVPEDEVEKLKHALMYVKHMGYGRHRGLGRCGLTCSKVSEQPRTHEKTDVHEGTVRLCFNCRLLSDLVLSQTSATSGPQASLDFIPGSCFWGIAANALYKSENKDSIYDVLYSGRCRFGDAHPAYDNIRTVRTPASFYHEKDKEVFTSNDKDGSKVYVSYKVTDWDGDIQPKQCRGGFMAVTGTDAVKVDTAKNMTIKTAWSAKTRSPEKSQLYAYESLDKGLEMLFWVEIPESEREKYAELIVDSLVGIKRVGRSRSAQFGLVEISHIPEFRTIETESVAGDEYAVYADSRLIFLDECGQPHYQPSPKDLGFANGSILWNKSQIRTFSYSSFNAYRGVHNSDYTGIEKGSVFIVRSDAPPAGDGWVGSFKSEGFGHIIYDPVFLTADESGLSKMDFKKAEFSKSKAIDAGLSEPEEVMYKWLTDKKRLSDVMSSVYDLNDGMHNYFNASISASQWGQIRQFAMVSDTYDTLVETIKTYISNGVSSDFWRGKAGDELKKYLNTVLPEVLEKHKVDKDDKDRFAQMAVVNLASLMMTKAKISSKSNKVK